MVVSKKQICKILLSVAANFCFSLLCFIYLLLNNRLLRSNFHSTSSAENSLRNSSKRIRTLALGLLIPFECTKHFPLCCKLQATFRFLAKSEAVESWFFEPPRETSIGSKNRRVREIVGKIAVFDWRRGTTYGSSYWEIRKDEGSRNRDPRLCLCGGGVSLSGLFAEDWYHIIARTRSMVSHLTWFDHISSPQFPLGCVRVAFEFRVKSSFSRQK